MNIETKRRLFMTLVILAMGWLCIDGFLVIKDLNELRQQHIRECVGKNFELFDVCFKQAEQFDSPTFLQWLSPYLPAGILVWIAWLFKLNLKLSIDSYPASLVKWFRWLAYFVGMLSVVITFFIVFEKSVDGLQRVNLMGLFMFSWIGGAWLSAYHIYEKLHNPNYELNTPRGLRFVAMLVISAPFFAILLLIIRQVFNF